MDYLRNLGWAVLVAVLLCPACEDGASDDTVTLMLTVNTFAPGETAEPIPDAEVCVADTEDCATTDGEGLAALDLPAETELEITVTAEGYNPTLLAEYTGEEFATEQTTVMITEAVAAALAALLGIDYPLEDAGVVSVTMTLPAPDEGGVPGTTLAMIDGDQDPYYVTEGGVPTYELQGTSPFGAGGFVDLPPGAIEIGIAGAARDCLANSAWPADSDDNVRIPVRAGFITFATMDSTHARRSPAGRSAWAPVIRVGPYSAEASTARARAAVSRTFATTTSGAASTFITALRISSTSGKIGSGRSPTATNRSSVGARPMASASCVAAANWFPSSVRRLWRSCAKVAFAASTC